MDRNVRIFPKDLKQMIAMSQNVKVRVVDSDTYLAEKSTTNKIMPSTLLMIEMPQHLGYTMVETVEESVKRLVKRLGFKQRFWTRAELTAEIFRLLSPASDQTDRSLKNTISKKLSNMLKEGMLLPVIL